MSVCIVAMFKNESHILAEWITHYISQGIDHFFMIDNNSNDNYIEILQPYITSGVVELFIDYRIAKQALCYNDHCFHRCKQYDWAIVCDLDEFIYARNGYRTIKDYLYDINKMVPSTTRVNIPWKMFGSNGYNTMDKGHPSSIIQSFTKRENYDKDGNYLHMMFNGNKKHTGGKEIVKTKELVRFGIHNHETTNTHEISSKGLYTINGGGEISEHVLEESFLHMNHYIVQSKKWFTEVKITRGDVNNVYNHRNENYFNRYDVNDIDDFELRDITICLRE